MHRFKIIAWYGSAFDVRLISVVTAVTYGILDHVSLNSGLKGSQKALCNLFPLSIRFPCRRLYGC